MSAKKILLWRGTEFSYESYDLASHVIIFNLIIYAFLFTIGAKIIDNCRVIVCRKIGKYIRKSDN